MSKYYNKDTDSINIMQWEVDELNRLIQLKIMSKSNKTENESKTFKKIFQYYDTYKCGYINYTDFIKALDRLGIVASDYEKYFLKQSNGNKYINYNELYENINKK